MKNLGYILILVGTLLASWSAVQPTDRNLTELKGEEVTAAAEQRPWHQFLTDRWFLLGFALGIGGVVAARSGAKSEAQAGDKIAGDLEALESSIDRIVDSIRQLDEAKESVNVYEVHGRIDELFTEDRTTFADARETIAHVYSLQAYADVMNQFAAGERYLNRVWSSSVDGYVDEVNQYLTRAREQFEGTQQALKDLEAARR